MEGYKFSPAGKQKPKPGKAAMTFGYIVVFGIIALIIWGIASALGGGSKPTASNSNSPANTSATTSAQSPPSTASQISVWNSKYGSIFTTLGNDLSTFSTDAKAGDVAASGNDCQQLKDDVATAKGQPAIPESTVEQHWSSALSYLDSAAQDCINGVNQNDVSLITQANNEMNQATDEINATTTAIQQASGQ